MAKPREGWHHLFASIPDVVWERLEADAATRGVSVAKIVTDALAKKYRIAEADLPKPLKAGPKPLKAGPKPR